MNSDTISPPEAPIQINPKPNKSRKKLLLLSLAVILVVGLLVGAYYLHNRKVTTYAPTTKGSLILYYRDGKTVLWDSTVDELNGNESPGFVASIKKGLQDRYGNEYLVGKKWEITTTLDSNLQKSAKDLIQAQQDQLNAKNIEDVSFVGEDVTNGQIVSWIGELDNAANATDSVTAKTEVGTLALPFVYATAMESSNKYTADATLNDAQEGIEGWPCTNKEIPANGGNCAFNLDFEYLGPMTLRQALGGLRLVPAIKTATEVGIEQVTEKTNKLVSGGSGFACYTDQEQQTKADCYGAAAIGDAYYATPQDIIQAYATLANDGKRLPQSTLLQVTIDGKTDYRWEQDSGTQALNTKTASDITDILSDPSASFLTDKSIFSSNGSKVSVQTGYSNNYRSGSMVQYSSKYAAGFWVYSPGENQEITGRIEDATQPILTNWLKSAE